MGVTVRQKRPGPGQPWHVFVHQGRRIVSRRAGTKREADALAAELRKRLAVGELNLGNVDYTGSPEFVEYAKQYIERYAQVTCKANTANGYESILTNHVEPAWKGRPLDSITRADVKRLLLSKQRDGKARGTIENIRTFISGVFSHAIDDELLTTNPASKLGRYLPRSDRRKAIKPLTREQSAAFLAAARQHHPTHYPMLLLAFRTGMRLGEIIGLTWADIDFTANTIEVRRSYSHKHWTTPKNSKSRIVDMSDQLGTTLQAHRDDLRQRFNGSLPVYQIPGSKQMLSLVFPSEVGGPIDGCNFRRRVFEKLFELADVPRCRFHDIRHTFASLLLGQGESLHYVKEQLGHASIQTTVDVYGHLEPSSNRKAVNRLDEPDVPALKVVSEEAG